VVRTWVDEYSMVKNDDQLKRLAVDGGGDLERSSGSSVTWSTAHGSKLIAQVRRKLGEDKVGPLDVDEPGNSVVYPCHD
jgi:hypothetical protein